jgi:hypothetical protein
MARMPARYLGGEMGMIDELQKRWVRTHCQKQEE